MYSVIRQGGMQFQVSNGEKVKVPKLDAKVGSEIEIKDVVLFAGEQTKIGRPLLDKAVVKAKVVSHGRSAKVTVFKRKRRKRYRKTTGHRQNFTELEILQMKCA